jgi:hypothetical protein
MATIQRTPVDKPDPAGYSNQTARTRRGAGRVAEPGDIPAHSPIGRTSRLNLYVSRMTLGRRERSDAPSGSVRNISGDCGCSRCCCCLCRCRRRCIEPVARARSTSLPRRLLPRLELDPLRTRRNRRLGHRSSVEDRGRDRRSRRAARRSAEGRSRAEILAGFRPSRSASPRPASPVVRHEAAQGARTSTHDLPRDARRTRRDPCHTASRVGVVPAHESRFRLRVYSRALGQLSVVPPQGCRRGRLEDVVLVVTLRSAKADCPAGTTVSGRIPKHSLNAASFRLRPVLVAFGQLRFAPRRVPLHLPSVVLDTMRCRQLAGALICRSQLVRVSLEDRERPVMPVTVAP